jgi:lipopolysaccharide heptosyltransferase II
LDISKLKKILIIRFSSLGDVLLTTPLIRSIKKTYPHLEIQFLTKPNYADVLKNNTYISKIFIFENSENVNFVIGKLKNERYDLIIDLQNNPRSTSIRQKLKINFLRFQKRDLDKLLLVKLKINKLKNAPPIPVRYAETVKGIKLDDEGLDLFTDKKPSFRFDLSKKYIGLCPGARHFTKKWPKEYFIELGKLLNENKFGILIFGGKADKELCTEISGSISNSINLSNNDEILQTAANMKTCTAIFCNDSGLMHTACAVNIPVFVFFGSSVKEFGFTPYKNRSVIFENNTLNCRPCSHIGRTRCPLKHFKCMKDTKPNYVFEEFLSSLKTL